MSRLGEIQSWMRWWGWNYTDGAMLKRGPDGVVIAHRGDAVWEADLDKAEQTVDRIKLANSAALLPNVPQEREGG